MSKHRQHEPRRSYRTVPLWRDVALIACTVLVAAGWVLTFTKY